MLLYLHMAKEYESIKVPLNYLKVSLSLIPLSN